MDTVQNVHASFPRLSLGPASRVRSLAAILVLIVFSASRLAVAGGPKPAKHSPPHIVPASRSILGSHYATAPAVWPPAGAPSPYVLQQSEATLFVHTLVFPDNFTLVVPAGWSQPLNWTTDEFDFGSNTTITLAPIPSQAPDGAPGAPPPGQPGVGINGKPGASGAVGGRGATGASLTLTAGTIVTAGSLWIQTDGQNGGAGGPGGKAQDAGGGSCGEGFLSGSTDAGNGGRGGPGGAGGDGGATAKVVLSVPMNAINLTKGCGPSPGAPSQRPSNLTGMTGTIAVYGVPGRGGSGASGGPGGTADTKTRGCGLIYGTSHAGTPGTSGAAGPRGNPGACTP